MWSRSSVCEWAITLDARGVQRRLLLCGRPPPRPTCATCSCPTSASASAPACIYTCPPGSARLRSGFGVQSTCGSRSSPLEKTHLSRSFPCAVLRHDNGTRPIGSENDRQTGGVWDELPSAAGLGTSPEGEAHIRRRGRRTGADVSACIHRRNVEERPNGREPVRALRGRVHAGGRVGARSPAESLPAATTRTRTRPIGTEPVRALRS